MESLKNKNIKRRDGLSWKELDDHIIILDSGTNKMVHHLEDTAAFIWKELSGNLSTNEIIDKVTNHFDIDNETANKDFESFITSLSQLDLIAK